MVGTRFLDTFPGGRPLRFGLVLFTDVSRESDSVGGTTSLEFGATSSRG